MMEVRTSDGVPASWLAELDGAFAQCNTTNITVFNQCVEEDCDAAQHNNAKALANRRKKEKKKAKQMNESPNASCSRSATGDEQASVPAANAPAEVEIRTKSAVVRAAQERIAAQRKLEEERQAIEAEQKRLLEEEQRKLEMEQARLEAEQMRRQEAKKVKADKKKTEGNRLTKKQKEVQARAARFREQLLSNDLHHANRKASEPKPEIVDADTDVETEDGLQASSGASEINDQGCDCRPPVVCVMGHVDAGKTSLLDRIRRTNIQAKEVGGITQQIGATMFPKASLMDEISKVDSTFDFELPGLLMIDTPGHATFNNLRERGTSLCDVAVLVVDIKKGLEPQTIESLNLLRDSNCSFIVALNKVDRLFGWKGSKNLSIQEAVRIQEEHVKEEFDTVVRQRCLELNQIGMNCALAWENNDPETTISLVPTSASTGDGIADLLFHALDLSQSYLRDQLKRKDDLQCSVMEVRTMERVGTTIDVLLKNGTLQEGDKIMVAGLGGPIVTVIKSLLTPQLMKDVRTRDKHISHKCINTSSCVRICAPGLDNALPGSELRKIDASGSADEWKEIIQAGMPQLFANFSKDSTGIFVKASEVGKLEAVLPMIRDIGVPVFEVGVGEVQLKDVRRSAVMKEKRHPEYAVILAFDVKHSSEAKMQAVRDGVKVISSSSIYDLMSQLEEHFDLVANKKGSGAGQNPEEAISPVIMQVSRVHHGSDHIALDCWVRDGTLRSNTPLCIPGSKVVGIGSVSGIERGRNTATVANCGENVCIILAQTEAQKQALNSADFGAGDLLCSAVTKDSLDAFKAAFRNELCRDDWRLINEIKQMLKIV